MLSPFGTTHPKLVDEHPMLVLPSLALAVGLNEAILLQQLHFLLRSPHSHTQDGRQWVYNTYDQWQTVFPFWKPRLLRILLTDMEKRGLLLSGNYNYSKADQTKWYTIDYEQLSHVTQNVIPTDVKRHMSNDVGPTDVLRQPMCRKTSAHVTQNVSSNQRLSPKTFSKELNPIPPTPFQGDAPAGENGVAPEKKKHQRKPTHATSSPEALAVRDHLNTVNSRRYTTATQIDTLLRTGVTVEDCRLVIDFGYAVLRQERPEWYEQYFDNVTPFRQTNFDKYRARAEGWKQHTPKPHQGRFTV